MDALHRITALLFAADPADPADPSAAVGWRRGLVLATLAALASSAMVFLAC